MARKEQSFNSQHWFCICILTYQDMWSDALWLQVQSSRYIAFIWPTHSCYPTPNKHQTPRTFILFAQTLPNDFLLHVCRLNLSPGIVIGCCLWGWWLLTAVVASLAFSSWLQLMCCCSEGYFSPCLLRLRLALTWCKRGHVGPRLQRLHLSGQCGQGRHSVLSLLQHIVPAQASHHAGQASQSGEIAFSKYFAKRWGVHREGTNNSFEEERPSESIKCTLRRFSDPTKRLTTSRSTFSVQTKKFDLSFWQKDELFTLGYK